MTSLTKALRAEMRAAAREVPAAVKGADAEIRKAFEDAYRVLQHKLKLLVALPVSRLGKDDLKKKLREIASAHP